MKYFICFAVFLAALAWAVDPTTNRPTPAPTAPAPAAPTPSATPTDCSKLKNTECCSNEKCVLSKCEGTVDQKCIANETLDTANCTNSCPTAENNATDNNSTTSAPVTVSPNNSSTSELPPTAGFDNSTTSETPGGSTTQPGPTPCPAAAAFHAASFIGGIVLCAGLVAIVLFACKFYQSRQEQNYHTL